MEQAYTHEFQCVYQLDKYPFDTQVRLSAYHILYVLYLPGMHLSFARETVELVPGILKMGQPSQMTLFRITHWNLLQSDILEGGMQVVVVMKRKIMS